MTNICKKCKEPVECDFCEAGKSGVLVPSHTCPNIHKDCKHKCCSMPMDLHAGNCPERERILNEHNNTTWEERLNNLMDTLENHYCDEKEAKVRVNKFIQEEIKRAREDERSRIKINDIWINAFSGASDEELGKMVKKMLNTSSRLTREEYAPSLYGDYLYLKVHQS